MPNHRDKPVLTLDERRRRIAAILAKGVIRWRRQAKAAGITDAQESSPGGETRLELSGETRLSVSDGTRGFTPWNDGDNA